MGKLKLYLLYRWIFSILLIPVCIYFLLHRGEYTLLDNFHLIVHEAGHLFFSFFGNFVQFLGGTLMQIIIPLLFLIIFYKSQMPKGMQFSFFLLGHSFINISVYAADARTQALPLLGNGKHDWAYLLNEINLITFDTEIGYFFFGLAILFFIIAIMFPLFRLNE
ncbi:MAG: hypothetical protein M0P61_16730 [Ignavibacteriaceae bacterium]|nr:hypothetical protein [Ignavibacteriaceae bacterium]